MPKYILISGVTLSTIWDKFHGDSTSIINALSVVMPEVYLLQNFTLLSTLSLKKSGIAMQFKINTWSLFNSQYNSISNQIVNMFFRNQSWFFFRYFFKKIWIVWRIASLTQCKSKIHLSVSCVIFHFTLILHWVNLRTPLEVFSS